mgnify:FL=1
MKKKLIKNTFILAALSTTILFGEAKANYRFISEANENQSSNNLVLDKHVELDINNINFSEEISYRNQQNDYVSEKTLKILGFLGGGPLGTIVSPKVYYFFDGNLVIWVIIGSVFGSFLWYAQGALVMLVIGLISQVFVFIFKRED